MLITMSVLGGKKKEVHLAECAAMRLRNSKEGRQLAHETRVERWALKRLDKRMQIEKAQIDEQRLLGPFRKKND